MENLAHTLAGLALARTGLARNRLETAVLVLGSNLPDIDLVWSMRSRAAYLDEHRGITHSLAGAPLAGVLFAGLVWTAARPFARSSAVFRRLLPLAVLAVLLHFGFDGLNDYGVRPFLPLDGRWVYGDLVFIVDPWFWMLLGGGLHLSLPSIRAAAPGRQRTLRAFVEAAGWTGWTLLSLIVLLTPPVPAATRMAWFVGVAVVAALRWRAARRPDPEDAGAAASTPAPASRTAPRWSFALLGGYVAALAIVHAVAMERARDALRAFPESKGAQVAALPAPANPMQWRVYQAGPEGLRAGTIHLLDPASRLTDVRRVERGLGEPEVLAALATPEGAAARRFSRFLFAEVTRSGGEPAAGRVVRLRDARYAWRGGGDGWATIAVPVRE